MSHGAILKHRKNQAAECRVRLTGTGLCLGGCSRSLGPKVWVVTPPSLPLSPGCAGNGRAGLALAVQPSVPITLKMPEDVVKRLRSHAQASGMAIGEIVAHAVASFLDKLHRHG